MRETMIKFLLMLARGIKFLAWFISRLVFDSLYCGAVAIYRNLLILMMILIIVLMLPMIKHFSEFLVHEEQCFIATIPIFKEIINVPFFAPVLLFIGLIFFAYVFYMKYRSYTPNIKDFQTLREFISRDKLLKNLYPWKSMRRSIKKNNSETRKKLKKIHEQIPAVIEAFVKLFFIIFFVGSLGTIAIAAAKLPSSLPKEFCTTIYSARDTAASVKQSADSAGQSADSAGQAADSAGQAADSAGQSADSAGQSADSAGQAADSAKRSASSAAEAKQAADSARQAADSAKRSASSAAEAKQAADSAKRTSDLLRKSSDSDKDQESSFGFFVFFTEEASMGDLKKDSESSSVDPNPTYKQQLKKFITGLPSDCENGKCYPIILEVRGFSSSSEWDFDNSNLDEYKENIEYCDSNLNQNNTFDKKCFGKDGEFHKEDCSDFLNVCTANLRAMNVRSELNDALVGNNEKNPNIELKIKKWETYSEMKKEGEFFADRKDGQFDKNLGLVNRRVEIRLEKIPERLDLSTEDN